MAKLKLELKSEISHYEIHAVVETKVGGSDLKNTKVDFHWIANVTEEQLMQMLNAINK